MLSALPPRIMNYPVSATSSAEELLTLGQILSEVGDYASTVLDRPHLSLAKRCAVKLRKVVGELISRGCIESAEDLYTISSEAEPAGTDFAAMTVGELYALYRRRPLRQQARAEAGREHLTYYYEARIINELKRRKAAGKGEQLKIDYCLLTYRNELDNLSFIFSKPVDTGRERISPETGRHYTPTELTSLIRLYTNYHDIAERELLVEYVDIALDLMAVASDKWRSLELASEILELGRRKIIAVPSWVGDFLAEALRQSRINSNVPASQTVLPLLTLHIHNGDPKLERRAARIINSCYRDVVETASQEDLPYTIGSLYTAVTFCTYVRRYNVLRIGTCLNELCTYIFSTNAVLSTSEILHLLSVVSKIENFTAVCPEIKPALLNFLAQRAAADDLEARAYLHTAPACMAKAV